MVTCINKQVKMFFVLVLFVICPTSSSHNLSESNSTYLEQNFQLFIAQYHKDYVKSSEEYKKRLAIFQSNVEAHRRLNDVPDHLSPDEAASTARYGITKFSDLTPEEFRVNYLSGMKTSQVTPDHTLRWSSKFVTPLQFETPKYFDWREHGVIGPVRDQKTCGGCWAFSTVETVETMYALTHSLPVETLSVQEVLDCSFGYYGLSGCRGGDTCTALDWMIETNVSIVSEVSYPFQNADGVCHIPSSGQLSGVKVSKSSCNDFRADEASMLNLIATHGPLAISVDASDWSNYQGGVIQYHCGEVPSNHGVQIVGYNLNAPIPYYIVKNSWGSDFGHDGYVYLKYGSNTCSLANHVSAVWVQV